jgi:hypothetical protein
MPISIDLSGRKELQRKALEADLKKSELQIEMVKRQLYPEQAASRAAEKLYTTQNPVERAALMNNLAETTGTRTIPGTNISIPGGLSEEDEVRYMENAVRRAAALQNYADAEPDPTLKAIRQEIATAGRKAIVAKGKELTAADSTFEQNVDAFKRFANDLESTVKEYGNFESFNPEGSAKLKNLNYQMAIAYAKLVDPNTAAREGEVEAAQKYLVPMSNFPVPALIDTPVSVQNKTTLEAIKYMKGEIDKRIASYQRTSGRKIQSATEASSATSSRGDTKPQPNTSTFQYDPRARRLLPGR